MADAVPVEEMLEIDRWILARASELVRQLPRMVRPAGLPLKVYRAIYDFATTDLSAVYFDVLKDRLYTAATKSKSRRSGQTALYKVHYALETRAGRTAPGFHHGGSPELRSDSKPRPPESNPPRVAAGTRKSLRLTAWMKPSLETWEILLNTRERVLKGLEEARRWRRRSSLRNVARSALCAAARLPITSFELHNEYASVLPSLFIVSQVVFDPPGAKDAPLEVTVERADGAKCERCWKYSTAIGVDTDYPTVCDSCAEATA